MLVWRVFGIKKSWRMLTFENLQFFAFEFLKVRLFLVDP